MSLIRKVLVLNNLLPQEDYQTLADYICSLSFNDKSPVFNISTGEHIVAEEIRKSHNVVIEDLSVLSLVKKTIMDSAEKSAELPSSVNAGELLIQLARDHVTFIKYEEGGFFGWHQDFEKYIVNERKRWIECHLLFCIEAAEEGGHLEVELDGSVESIPLYKNTCIIFDKNLKHRACTVLKGRKIIMTADVLVSTKYVQRSHSLDMEMVEYVSNRRNFLSYNIDILQKDLDGFGGGSVFLLLEVQPDKSHGRIYVFDSVGPYYVRDEEEWQRSSTGERYKNIDVPDGIVDFNHFDLDAILDGEVTEVIRNDLQSVNLNSYAHLPLNLNIETILQMPRIHTNTSKKVEYLYYCNEACYGSVTINELIGVIY